MTAEAQRTGYAVRSHLSSRQILALPILAIAPNITEAAREAGISRSTLHRWLQNDHFHCELLRLTAETAQLTRDELQGLTLRGIKVITDLMEDSDPTVRLRAARAATILGVQATGTNTLSKSIPSARTNAATTA